MSFHDKVRNYLPVVFDNLGDVIDQYLREVADTFEEPLQLLDLGCGDHPELLKRVHEQSTGMRLHVDFLDKDGINALVIPSPPGTSLKGKGGTEEFGDTSFSWTFIQTCFVEGDLPDSSKNPYHIVVAHAVIHELLISSEKHPLDFLEWFFEKMNDYLLPGGYLLFGGPYYPSYLSREDVVRIIEDQCEKAGHADPPAAFIHPEQILQIALRRGRGGKPVFELLHDQAYFVRVNDIGRKWYLSVLRKKTGVCNAT